MKDCEKSIKKLALPQQSHGSISHASSATSSPQRQHLPQYKYFMLAPKTNSNLQFIPALI